MWRAATNFTQNNGIEVQVPQFNIISDDHFLLQSRYFEKIYRVVSDKRFLYKTITLPYGFAINTENVQQYLNN